MPDSPSAIYLEGDCRAFTGEYAALIKTDRELFALDPDDTQVWRVFPLPYVMLDMVEEARYWFDRLAEVNPDDSYSRLGQILLSYYLQEDEEGNFRLVREILTEDPDLGYHSLEIALVVLTEYGAKLRQHDIVLEVLQNLYPNLFDDPPNDLHASDLGLYFTGLALLQSGDIDRGTFLMKAYLEEQDRADEAYAVRWRSITGRRSSTASYMTRSAMSRNLLLCLMNIARTQQSNDASCRKWASIKRIWYYFHIRYWPGAGVQRVDGK
jgi:hypothetical protein